MKQLTEIDRCCTQNLRRLNFLCLLRKFPKSCQALGVCLIETGMNALSSQN